MAEGHPPNTFSESERVRIREILEAFKGLSFEEMEQLATLGRSGKTLITVLGWLVKIITWAGGAAVAFAAIKGLFHKGGA